MKVKDLRIGDEFRMDGLTVNGKKVKPNCKLIRYNGLGNYVIESNKVTILVNENDEVYI